MPKLVGTAKMETRTYECTSASDLDALEAWLKVDGWRKTWSGRQDLPPYTVTATFVKTAGEGDYWCPDWSE